MQKSSSVVKLARDEEDNLERSVKKCKEDGDFSHDQSLVQREESWMKDPISFKEMLMKHNGEWESDVDSDEGEDSEDSEELDDMNEDGVKKDNEEGRPGPEEEVLVETRNDGRTNFKLSTAFKKKAWKPWKQSLIVKLLGKKLSIGFMKKRLESMWARYGKIFVTDIDNDFFLVRFEMKEDMVFAMTAGPWILFDHYLAIRAWEPDFQPFQASITRVTAWVRLPGFPMEYVNTPLIKSVGNWLGKFVRLDTATTNLARGKFARICVELDLINALKAEYYIEGRYKKIEYEGLHMICFNCGKYGHSAEACPDAIIHENGVEKDGASNTEAMEEGKELVPYQSPVEEKEENFGPWMVVTRSRKQLNAGGKGVNTKNYASREAVNKPV